MLIILHQFCIKYNPHFVLKITQFVCYVLNMICVYKIQAIQNMKFWTVYIVEQY